jgi:hypothetical protein
MLTFAYCFEPEFRPFLGNNLAKSPSRKIPTRMAISAISTVELVIANLWSELSVVSYQQSAISNQLKADS